ncbi:hypothetical protein [Paenibacillus sanfengchensis]|uniref:hypothetical protein n=1 Tax=Paenibacillus sanfengchensis TaxID=3119819 RepID=UPI002FE2CAA7
MLAYKYDYIFSEKLNKDLAYIEIQEFDMEYHFQGDILKNNLPEELIELTREYWGCVDDFSISLLDDIVTEIQSYKLKLRQNNLKIFDPEIDLEDNIIKFTIKYFTSNGVYDDYPE